MPAVSTLICFLCLLQGCATLPWETISPADVEVADTEEFKQYVESVFRRQNNATNQLIEIFEEEPADIDGDTYDALEIAEEEMLGACEPLNQIAAQESSGEAISLRLKLAVVKTVEQCDKATKTVENLLTGLKRESSHNTADILPIFSATSLTGRHF